jgi:general secretion pathway protein D
MNERNMKKISILFLLALLLASCAGDRYHREGLGLLREGKAEEGIAALEKAVQEENTNAQFRKDLEVGREAQVGRFLAAAQSRRQAGKLDEAEALYQRVLGIDPADSRARDGVEALARDRSHADRIIKAREALKSGDVEKAAQILRPAVAEDPDNADVRAAQREIEETYASRETTELTLRSLNTKPINLEFRDASIRMIFDVLARTTGVSFIFDKDVRPDLRTTVFLKGATFEEAVETILQTNQLQKKLLSANTVLIYPSTPDKLRDYQELVVRAFYLANANVKQVESTFKTLLKTKELVIDEKLNLIVMRDSPEAVRVAEKVVALLDLAEPEVMIEVEVMEVQRSRLLDLGIQWPNSLTLTPLASSGSTLTAHDLRRLNSDRVGASIGSATINARQDNGDANLLANPRVRVRNREKAKVLIGDKIPVVTTTTTATGIVSDSVQYLDVGLKVEFEPDIHLHDEVAMKVELEVSSLGTKVTTPSGTIAYQIGTRTASTVLRLKDGETQILAGLISDQEHGSGSGVPGLIDIPLLGRLFGSRQDDHQKTEIVLSITPHVVRNLNRPSARNGEFWSGTESSLRAGRLSLRPTAKAVEAAAKSDTDESSSTTLGNAPKKARVPKTIALSWLGPDQVKAGQVFKASLQLKTDGEVRSVPLQMTFDTAVFQVVSVTEGTFFQQEGGTSGFSSNTDAGAGKFFVTAMSQGNEGASGEGTVAVVVLRALAASPKAELRVTSANAIAVDGGSPVVALPAPLSITVTP